MTVSTTTNRISYAGNGVTVLFSFANYLTQASDLKAIHTDSAGVETLWVLNTDYTLAFIGSAINGVYPGGANITAAVAPAAGEFVSLYRDVPETQTTHWTDNDPMPSSTLENTVDKTVLMVQRLFDLASRSIRLKDGFVPTFDTTLPEVTTADYFLKINATNDGFDLGQSNTGPAGPTGPTGATGATGPAGASAYASVSAPTSNVALAAGSPVNMQYAACDATGGAFNVTLPAALIGTVGQVFSIKKIDSSANTVSILRNGSDVIIASSSVTSLALDFQGKSFTLVCRAAGIWDVI
jgi:hypothetical protein